MPVSGVIAEFNPLHNGHRYIIEQLKRDGDVVCVIGDDFTQRGDVAVISKYARAEAALACGADLCILMPVAWSSSCAQNFALGGISLLKNTGIVDRVAFGSECGNIELLKKVSNAIADPSVSSLLSKQLQNGKTFAAARQNAVRELIGCDADILSNPNDILACEYIGAARQLGFNADFTAIKRVGCAHDSTSGSDKFLSASAVRAAIGAGKMDDISDYLPQSSLNILIREQKLGRIADILRLENAIVAALRTLTPEDMSRAPEISEGLENRIYSAVRRSGSLQEILSSVKSKRYTLARIRRIILYLFLGIDTQLFRKPVPYIKVLGFNKTGERLLKEMKPDVPLIMRGNDYKNLCGDAILCFDLQSKASDMAALAMNNPPSCGREFTEKLIKI